MIHVRTQIRKAVAAALAGLPTTGARVFQNRRRPLRDTDLPCLLVNTDDEQIVADGVTDDCALLRTLSLNIRGVVKDSVTLDYALDDICAEVEPVLNNNRLGNLVKSCVLQSIGIDTDDALEQPAGIVTLQFQAQYFTSPDDPGIAL